MTEKRCILEYPIKSRLVALYVAAVFEMNPFPPETQEKIKQIINYKLLQPTNDLNDTTKLIVSNLFRLRAERLSLSVDSSYSQHSSF